MTDDEWITEQTRAVRRALADPDVRHHVLDLLGQDGSARRRRVRLEAARAELEARGLLDPDTH